MVNGFAYGYLNRHSNEFRSVYGSPTEDVERSCRFFNADGIVLRYSMRLGVPWEPFSYSFSLDCQP